MIFLPIVDRELRVAARRKMTYRTRQVSVLVALLLAVWVAIMTGRYGSSTEVGRELFQSLSIFSFVYCLLAGARTADCISNEKLEGTLGLLFLTDLKGYDVVLGKLIATSLNSFYGLLAIFPILSMPMLAGGVGWGDFWRMALVLVNTLLFSLAAGLWISARAIHGRRAMFGTLVLLVFFTGLLPWMGDEIKDAVHARQIHPAFKWPSPGYNFIELMDSMFGAGKVPEFWKSLLTVQLLAWTFLVWAAIKVPRSWQDRPADIKAARRRSRFETWSLGSKAKRNADRARQLEKNPVLWLDDRYRLQKTGVWLFLLVFATIWLWNFNRGPTEWFREDVINSTGLLCHGILKVWLASQATRRFAEDRRSGALELLLSTSLSVKEILRGQRSALRRQFGLPILAVVIADVLLVVGRLVLYQQWPWWRQQASSWLLIGSAGITMFVIDAYAISWLGAWLGLRCKNSLQAAGYTIAIILILPWMLFGGLFAANALWKGFNFRMPWTITCWLIIGLLVDLICIWWARRKLHRSFRQIATERFEGAPGHRRWWRLFRRTASAMRT